MRGSGQGSGGLPPGGMQRPPGDPALRHQASADAQAGPAALFRSYVAIPILPPLRSAAGYVRRPLGAAARVWRRSIQLRVVATTLLLSLGVVLLLGLVVIGQVRNGLLEAKLQSARSQALGGFAAAQDAAAAGRDPRTPQADGSSGGTQLEPGTWLNNMVETLASGGQGLYAVVALSSDYDNQPFTGRDSTSQRGPRATGNVVPEESVPRELRQVLDREDGVHEQYTQVVRDNDGLTREAGLAIGKRLNDIDGNPYQLYYLFPFEPEEGTLSLVKGTLATAGIFVVVLLGAIAWVVARQVVTPVRMAARISERLAAGLLQERMQVTGEDDIARLGQSFNKMAKNLQTKIQELEELSRMQRRFVSDVSHELRTPLTTVRMAADLLYESRGEFDAVTARSAELLQNQLDRFESLLTDLLEISRFDAGAAALEAEQADLRDVVHQVVEAAEPLAERKGSALVVLGDEASVLAEVDTRRVSRILRNLVVNAVEHGEGRDVVVRLAEEAGAVAVAVRDYGVGLKPGEASRVFDRFWRADPARARTTGGTGLGLSIALEDARLHGGWLHAWGEPGGGSQFRLTLPAVAGEPLHSSPVPLEPADSRDSQERAAASAPPPKAPAALPPPPFLPALPYFAQLGNGQRRTEQTPGPAALPGDGSGASGTVTRVVGRTEPAGGDQEDGPDGR